MFELFPESEGEVHQRLCSQSELLIRREDVLQRSTPDSRLSDLSEGQADPRWKDLDVEGNLCAFHLCRIHLFILSNAFVLFCLLGLGQVRQMVQEEGEEHEGPRLTHIRIPAAYSSGITFFALRQSELGRELLSAPELPVL